MIYDGAGGDCTAMWESYHPLALVKSGPPQKYLIGTVRAYKDFYSWTGDFFYKLKERVEEKIPKSIRRNEPILITKGIIILISWFIMLYMWITRYNLWTTIVFSFVSGMVGVNVMHDGNHSAWSSNKLLTYIARYTLDLCGSTSVVYRRSHNFGHHGCVNHFELDR
jgi:fatty acid desaturase